METTHQFLHANRPPGIFAIQGHVYHRVQPNHPDLAVQWFLYDGLMHDKVPHLQWAETPPPSWIAALTTALRIHNLFVQSLSYLSTIDPILCPTAHLTLEDRGSRTEVAAVMNYANMISSEIKSRNVIVIQRDGENQSISTISRLWEPLAYPLFFLHGTLGWGVVGSTREIESGIQERSQDDVDGATRQIMHYHT